MRRFGLVTLVAAVLVVVPVSVGWSTSASEPSVTGSASASVAATRTGNVVSVDPGPPPPTPVALHPELEEVFRLTNLERTSRGLPALTLDPRLNEAAQSHSEYQAAIDDLTHTGPPGLRSPGDRIAAAGYQFRTWAENAAYGYRDAAGVMNGWMNSPGHRDNILRTSVTEIGLGLAYTPSGRPYWTQVFAAPR